MSDIQIDLNNCDREPIHIPGQIQSHGFIVAIDKQHIIRFHSENITDFIPELAGELLEQPLTQLQQYIFHKHNEPVVISQLINLGESNSYEQVNPYAVQISGQQWYLIISSSDELLLLEFELAADPDQPELQGMVGSSIAQMLADRNLGDLLNNTASQVKKIIEYDRVMVYRFAEDGHGEVVAEAKNDDLETWLGLHYPASDIPKQARELYKRNFTRIIADVHSSPSKIITRNFENPQFDLTNSQLRAVSPIHIQYLINMGVASSFSISIISKGELWGLIACHNYTPKFINYKSRISARLIGQILSSAFEFRQDEENQQAQMAFNLSFDKLSKSLAEYDNIDEALTGAEGNLMDITHATGVVIAYEGRLTHLGITPDEALVHKIAEHIHSELADPLYATDHLESIIAEAGAFRQIASGMLFCSLSKELNEFVMWFKPEKLHTVKWAGNPDKAVEIGENGIARISPRNSFAVWSETVAGKSETWKPEEIKFALRLKEEISYNINQKAGAIRILNERLRQAYDELDTFSYTISHDLKNPLSIIKSYTQLIKRDESLSERSLSFAARIEDRAERMNDMIQEILEYSRIGRGEVVFTEINMQVLINEIISDLVDIYGQQTQFVIGDLPGIEGDLLMIRQVFSNLVGNAVKYSQPSSSPIVEIRGVQEGREVTYVISDNGIGIPEQDLPFVFDLFKRMDNTKDIEGSGVGLAIVKRIVNKHKATIWAESKEDNGSAFHVRFVLSN